mgnify:CR=1 FL=1
MARSQKRVSDRFIALGERNYRNYFFGTAISNSGNWAHRVAQDWLILNLTDSAQLLGVVVAAQFLPGFFFSLHAGKLADKVNPKKAPPKSPDTQIKSPLSAVLRFTYLSGLTSPIAVTEIMNPF